MFFDGVNFQTVGRDGFVQASSIVAGAVKDCLEEISDLCIRILARRNTGKSLFAETLLSTLDDNKNNFDVPFLDRLSIEKFPTEASCGVVSTSIFTHGRPLRYSFTTMSESELTDSGFISQQRNDNFQSSVFVWSTINPKTTLSRPIHLTVDFNMVEIGVASWNVKPTETLRPQPVVMDMLTRLQAL